MKNTLLILASLCFLGFQCDNDPSLIITTCLPQNLQIGLLAMYSFNDGSLSDGSGNAHFLTNATTAKPATDRDGNVDCAFEFDQTVQPEFLSLSNTSFLNSLSAFSISMWFMPKDTTRDGGKFEVLLSRGNTGRCPNRRGEWSVGLYDCRRPVFGHNNSVWANEISAAPFDCQSETNAWTERWHHVVAIFNNDNYSIFINGVLDEMKSGAANCSSNYMAVDFGDLFIGTDYTGLIDDVALFGRALSTTEIAELNQLPPCCQ